ncbi:hypothetical protein VNO78_09451 [Psophocarpus tetragonolobus]|uniref:C2 domain-containing protein n=1 Tax=Psophocarpus tetragonolobus TaxID=3891 RepID=A0AAN9XTK9_PSOTE
MDNSILGLLKIRIKRGINLAIRDAIKMRASDPYVVVSIGEQNMLRTSTVKDNCNPEWNEEFTLSIKDVKTPIHLAVYDKDTFSGDDKMGDADIDLKPYVQCVQMQLNKLPNGFAVKRILPDNTNCLAENSTCIWKDGKIIQEMILKLRNVESGELVVEIEWVDVIGCKGLSEVKL